MEVSATRVNPKFSTSFKPRGRYKKVEALLYYKPTKNLTMLYIYIYKGDLFCLDTFKHTHKITVLVPIIASLCKYWNPSWFLTIISKSGGTI